MRKSNKTNTLVIVTDYTRGIYHDKQIGGVLHYTGMGLYGNQDINYMQNKTLNESDYNGVDVHLFEVMESKVYTYCGRVKLAGKPYNEIQKDKNGIDRSVWVFPVRPVPDNNVAKPSMYVFKDMADYKARGTNVYYLKVVGKKQTPSSGRKDSNILIGRKIKHKVYGLGTIIKYDGRIISTKFCGEIKALNYEFCIEKGLIDFIQEI